MGKIAVGKITRGVTKKNNVVFQGWLANVPVVGFHGTKDGDRETIYFWLDTDKAKYLEEKSDKKENGNADTQASEDTEVKEPETVNS